MIFKDIQLLIEDLILIISVFLVSAFYSSILTAYSAIVLTKTSSPLFKFFLNKDISILKVYILAVFIINLSSLILFIILGFGYLYLTQNYSNGFMYYFFLASSFPSIYMIFILIIRGRINIHKISNILFYVLISSLLLPQLIERTIS